MIRHFLMALAVSVAAWPALAAEVYPDGANSIAPLQKAVNAAKPGEVIVVKPGSYNGSLSLSGVNGTADKPIQIVSETVHGAVINGSSNSAAINAWGVSNVVIQDFQIVSNAKSGDEGGIKLGGDWNAPATGVVITGNKITGQGQDGIKLYNGATGNTVVGNEINGDWRQEAIDGVSISNSVIAYNTVTGTAKFSGLTFKAGSNNIEVVGNEFAVNAPVQISVGGYGNSRLTEYGDYPDEWKGPEASNSVIHKNNIKGDVQLVSAVGNTIKENSISGSIGNGFNSDMPDSVQSSNNVIQNNGKASIPNIGVINRPMTAPALPGGPVSIPIALPGQQPSIQPATGLAPNFPVPDASDPNSIPISADMPDIPIAPYAPANIPVTISSPNSPTYFPINPPSGPELPTVVMSSAPLLAQAPALGPGVLNGIVDTFKSQASKWEGTLEKLAIQLFGALAGIELLWVFGRAIMKKMDIADVLELVVMQMVTIGFFFWLLLNTADFTLAIVASFGEAGNQASIAGGGSANASPTDVFSAGLNMAQTIWSGMTFSNPGLSFLLAIAGVINVWVFAQVTGKLIEVLVESAIVAYAGILMMGFGGSGFTRDYAIAQFRFALSVGAKRFMIQLIIGLSQGIIVTWADMVAKGGALNWVTIGIMVGAPIVMLRLVETIPQRAQDMVNGQSSNSHGSLTGTAAAVGGAGMVVAATLTGAGVAAKAAYQLASKQLEARDQNSGQKTGGIKKVGALAGMTAMNYQKAAANDVGKRLNGTGGRHGIRTFRMANDMKKKAANQ